MLIMLGCIQLVYTSVFFALLVFLPAAFNIYNGIRYRYVPMLTIEDTHMVWTPIALRSPTHINREDFIRVERSDMGWLKGGECLTIHWAQGKFTIPVNSIGAENANDVMERLSSWMPEEYVAW